LQQISRHFSLFSPADILEKSLSQEKRRGQEIERKNSQPISYKLDSTPQIDNKELDWAYLEEKTQMPKNDIVSTG
jgi:hypothetical protein